MEQYCILAGNSRVEKLTESEIKVEGQIMAFRAALERAAQISDKTGTRPRIAIALDHKGVFRKQFLSPFLKLTNSQKRHPRLSHLHPDIVNYFANEMKGHFATPDDIFAVHEDSAKAYMTHLVETKNLPIGIERRITIMPEDGESCKKSVCGLPGPTGPRVNCAAITREYFRQALRESEHFGQNKDVRKLEVYIEDDPWTQVSVYSRGVQLTHLLGSSAYITLIQVGKDGTLYRGEEIEPLEASEYMVPQIELGM